MFQKTKNKQLCNPEHIIDPSEHQYSRGWKYLPTGELREEVDKKRFFKTYFYVFIFCIFHIRDLSLWPRGTSLKGKWLNG